MINDSLLNNLVNNKYDEIDSYYVMICKEIIKYSNFKYSDELDFKIADTLKMVEKIFGSIDNKYKEIFINALKEKDENKPIIYLYNSNNLLEENESICFYNQVSIYKRNKISDVYIIFHEFTHLLTNINLKMYEKVKQDKDIREIPSILGEFIVCYYLTNYGITDSNYIKGRFNSLRKDSISLLIKNEIINLFKSGNLNNQKLINNLIELGIKEDEMEFVFDELLYNKSLNVSEEISYINGYFYGYKYYKEDALNNYKCLIKKISSNELILGKLDILEINKLLNNSYMELSNNILRM